MHKPTDQFFIANRDQVELSNADTVHLTLENGRGETATVLLLPSAITEAVRLLGERKGKLT
jgi:hypothetical protein